MFQIRLRGSTDIGSFFLVRGTFRDEKGVGSIRPLSHIKLPMTYVLLNCREGDGSRIKAREMSFSVGSRERSRLENK